MSKLNTRFINWHTIKLPVIWLAAVITQGAVLDGNLDLEYQSIMMGGLFSAIATLLIVFGITAEIKGTGYWTAANVLWALSMNIYLWLFPFVPDLLPAWAWWGVAAITIASITTVWSIGNAIGRYPKAAQG